MTVIFGQRGQPAATISDDVLFDAKGNQIAFLEDELIFSAEDGEFWGSYSNGVVFNSSGVAQGFAKNAKPGIPAMAPGMTRLPPRLKQLGDSIEHLPFEQIPDFLRSASAQADATFFDGRFQ